MYILYACSYVGGERYLITRHHTSTNYSFGIKYTPVFCFFRLSELHVVVTMTIIWLGNVIVAQ